MKLSEIMKNRATCQKAELESYADEVLVGKVGIWLEGSLREARQSGKHGWWDKDICYVNFLVNKFETATNRNDWKAVIAYAAMIQARTE